MAARDKSELLKNALAQIECYSLPENTPEAKYSQISIDQLADLGVTFTPLIPAIKMAVQNAKHGGPFRMVLPSGTDNVKTVSAGTAAKLCTVLTVEPTVVLMAVAITAVNRKLGGIEKKQKEMFEYLKLREKAKQMGNMAVLSEILDDYRYNYTNENYKNHKHIQVQEIKRDAEHSIIFSREAIESKVNQKQLLHSDRDVKLKIQAIQNEFKDYELALYLYSFSSFLEIMLLENFDKGYLESISAKICDYTDNYRSLNEKCQRLIESDSETSVRAKVLTGVAGFNRFMGRTMSKIPGINETILDEKLMEAGSKVHELNAKQTKNTADMFSKENCDFIKPFIDNIKTVSALFNGEMDIVFDENNVYFAANT